MPADDVRKARAVATLRTLLLAGYDPESVVEFIRTNDLSELRHEGQYPVQLQPPDDETPAGGC